MVSEKRTTIGVRRLTKKKLDKNRAPGQCYDGFICQLVDLWEKVNEGRTSYVAGPAGETRVLKGSASPISLNRNSPLP